MQVILAFTCRQGESESGLVHLVYLILRVLHYFLYSVMLNGRKAEVRACRESRFPFNRYWREKLHV